MEDFRVYSPEDIITANLQELSSRFDLLVEQELAHVREFAFELANEATDLQKLLQALPDHRPPAFAPKVDVAPAAQRALTLFHRTAQTQKCVLLCAELCRALTQKRMLPPGFFFQEADNNVSVGAIHRIVYQRSSYTDSAYLRLSALLSEPRASYTHSFLSACEEVYNGFCEYCILPVENSTEGLLISFSELIERFDLKIAASCKIDSGDGRMTRFALLRKNMLPLFTHSPSTEYFECALPSDAPPEIADVLTAAQLCDLQLHRVDSIPSQTAPSHVSIRLSFCTTGGDLKSFLLYLAMEAPHYTPIGLYPHLLQKGK